MTTSTTRRGFAAGAAALGLTACAGLQVPQQRSARRPSILVFIADDAGARDFGIYGNAGVQTPHIDRFGRAGLVCDTAILTTPQCSPSRISILSGLHPHATGAEDLHMPAPDGLDMVQGLLSRAGYFTGGLKKMHLGPAGEAQFDWYRDDLVSLPEFLSEAGERPFFMWVGFTDPHRSYDRASITQTNSPDEVTVPPWLIDDVETRRDLADYYNEISRMDADIGRMMGELEAAGRLTDTLVLIISDNGAPFPRAKGTLYDSGIRTPFIAHWPARIGKGVRHHRLMSVIDLAPTFLDLAGVSVPDAMQGESIAAGLSDPAQLSRDYAFSSRNWHNTDAHMRAVRSGQYKLITNAYTELPYGTASDIGRSPSFRSLLAAKQAGQLTPAQAFQFQAPRPPTELYDLDADPLELTNLAGDPAHAETQAQLRAVLENWRRRTGDHDPSTRRRPDNVDRQTGLKPDGAARLPEWIRPDG